MDHSKAFGGRRVLPNALLLVVVGAFAHNQYARQTVALANPRLKHAALLCVAVIVV